MNILLKNKVKELQVFNYKIGLNNWICKKGKNCKKN